ncbi:hypothetical protein [Microbacterium sp. A94]|uniref:hypothetical protein n=1 Tax=Microbacterium sp. A94 TaxID=3450717 RepID=UPI003F423A4A
MKTVRQKYFEAYRPVISTRAELHAAGMTGNDITAAVRYKHLLRLRRNHYARPDLSADVAEAVRIGGRISCLSLLQMIGIFVLEVSGLHVHVPPLMSRIRTKKSKSTRLHWGRWSEDACQKHVVPFHDAVRQAIRCQTPRAALATLDSIVHHGLMTYEQLVELFADLPDRFRALLPLVDASAASGPETFMRLILRSLGVTYETQVLLPGVGYVDFIVDGWLIIECDSKEFHEGWEKQVEDRDRDIAAAQLGYVTVRPLAGDVLWHSTNVRRQLVDIIAALGPKFINPGRA